MSVNELINNLAGIAENTMEKVLLYLTTDGTKSCEIENYDCYNQGKINLQYLLVVCFTLLYRFCLFLRP